MSGSTLPSLRRSDDRVLAGVCGGIAEALGVDPTLIRLLFTVLALASAAAFVAPFLHLGDGVGSRSYQPAVLASVQSQYRLGIGNLDVDLSHVSFGSKPTTVELRLGIGKMRVTVPHDATVLTHAHVAWGDSSVLGDKQSGHAVHADLGDPHSRLVLDAHVGIGKLEVVRASG